MDDRQLLERFGSGLTVKQREAFELAVRGMSERAIGLALDLSREGVRARLVGARRSLERAARAARDSKEAA